MTADHAEIEVKLDIDETTPLPRLDSLPAVASVSAVEQVELEATYYDTADLTLLSRGVTLRRRAGGHDAGWHLKLPDDGSRYEVHAPLGRNGGRVPAKLRALVRAHIRDEPLVRVANLRTRRQVHQLLDDAGAVLAEVCDDRVRAEVPAGGSHQASSSAWREWEVELAAGDGRLLEDAAAALRDAGAAPSRAPSKLVRALGDRLPRRPEPPPAPRKSDPAATVIRARLAEQVESVHRLDPLVRCDAPDAVHRMRVALRRLRSALATYRPFVARERTDPLRDELAWLGQVLGAARDTEVMHERLRRMLAEQPPETVRGPVLTRVDRHMEARHQRALAEADKAMRSPRYYALLDRLDALVSDPPLTPAASEPAGDVLLGRVRHDWNRLKNRVKAVTDADDPADHAARLHDVRKAAKRARYAGEPMIALYGKRAKRFVKATKEIQTVLGDHQDGVVLQQQLRDLADGATADGDSAFTYGVLHAQAERDAVDGATVFPKAWRRARAARRRWLC